MTVVNGRVPPDPLPADEVLVARVALGDVAAFALLRYARPVYAMAVHLLGPADGEEAAQEAFLRLWNKADQFDPARGSFAAWFIAVARHHVFRELRGRSQRHRLAAAEDVDRLLAQAADPTIDVEEQAWRRDEGAAVRRALDGLPADQRRALVLAYFGGLSQSAIAQHLGWPLGTVKKRIRLGMQKLRLALAQQGAAMPPSPASAAARSPVEAHDGL